MDDILLGTRHTLERAREAGVRRALYVSSGAVYGRQPADVAHAFPKTRPLPATPLHPGSAYGEAKRAPSSGACSTASSMASPFRSPAASPSSAPPCPWTATLPSATSSAMPWPATIQVSGDGSPLRSYLYGADLAIWLLTLLLQGQHGRACNVGADQALSIAELAHLVRDTLAPAAAVHIAHGHDDKAGRNRYIPSIQRARHELALDAWTPLEEAIRLTAECASPVSQP
jgi:nucleoside-diphosphate-sugar epimerase